jgi:cytochrome bd ubiquinol oxidase subunit II
MTVETLELLWYIVFITAIFAYAALDGFDIGVGCLHLFSKSDTDRRIFLNAIGPVWDGNSLWVIISIGGLLAGFPNAFATLFSTLYIPTLFLVSGYIIRAVAIEFRSKMPSPVWRNSWDIVFSFASYLLAFGFGVILANLIKGLPITKEGDLVGGTLALFPPYALLLGLFTTLLFMLHGALFLNLKTEGKLQKRVQLWLQNIHLIFFFVWGIVTILTLIYEAEMADMYRNKPITLSIVIMALVGLTLIPKFVSKKWEGRAFLSSFLIIGSLVMTYALGTFPAIVKTCPKENSLTIYNSAASALTLEILLYFALLGVPLILLYAIFVYRVFKGKVALDTMSY